MTLYTKDFIGLRWVHFAARGPNAPERWTLQQGYIGQDGAKYWMDVPTLEMPHPDNAHESLR